MAPIPRQNGGSTQSDLFYHIGMSTEVEDLSRYKQHGLHPIILGQVLPEAKTCVDVPDKEPSYRIMFKLGFGAFSTVWMARDMVEDRWVSVKICEGSEKATKSAEVAILTEIRDTFQGKPGFNHIIQLLDTFIIKGPNGFHECIVTEIIASLADYSFINEASSAVSVRQIAQAFALLHEHGIAHGDPHPANVGVTLPQMDGIDENAIVSNFPQEQLVPVAPRSATFPRETVPAYAVPKESLVSWLRSRRVLPGEGELQIKILDFGRAHRTSDEASALLGAVPPIVQPPETVIYHLSDRKLGSPWSQAADVWAVACIMFYTLGDGELLSASWSRMDECLLRCLELGGPPIEAWAEFVRPKLDLPSRGPCSFGGFAVPMSRAEIENTNVLCAPGHYYTDRDLVWEKQAARCYCKGEQREAFVDLLKRMIVTDPEQRISMQEVLAHPFCLREWPSSQPVE
ncbi:hypothetical protein LLEC1_03911 [Akanthomyces lecanii]|uniref:Protein kinase domain-containing protein n=1 Tax=Cordyceps confragosa TaxID=2714763 RepID=A0A179I7V1_CORDF|nr:hypothetical protein LLEC1_03911 [Akanthomyces lecanii]